MINKYQPSRFFIISLLVCLFITSVLIRAYYIKSTVIINPIIADAREYIIYGYNIAFHDTFSKEFPSNNPSPDSFRSPGYPLFVALSFIIGGEKGYYDLLLYSQAVIGGFLSVLTYMAGILFLPFFGAITASVLVTFSPHLISMTSYCLTETLFSFTLLTSVLFFLYAIKKNHFVLFFISAVLCGCSYLVNETFLFLPYICVFTFILIQKIYLHKKTSINCIVFIIIFSLFPCMWMVRNSSLSSDAPQGNSRAIATMSHGSYPDFIYKTEKYKYLPYREDPEQPEFGISLKNFIKILSERIKQRPYDYFVWYSFKKPYYLWSWNILQGQGDVYIYPVTQSLYSISKFVNTTKKIMHTFHPFFTLLSFSGISLFFFQVRNKNAEKFINVNQIALIFYIIFIYYTLLYMVFAPWPRYSIPLRPVFYLCAIWTSVNILNWVKNNFNNKIVQI